ncbi:type II toxin-antitoxin system Phd/YefM family antitoxin [Paramicrobacterium humi]|uniref:type II toxin-antitoxin system Phd/YefM family antitoxin n=1 Tax=Paramicrobacterium humi TaxID=640635 RepID=UPI000B896057|nr:type II toxin-antitoxin system prevent-host-death family antitoxin [Microbacterium humi]
MNQVGIRALKQNASAVVASAASGQTVTITDRGRAVAQLSPIPSSSFERLRSSGRLRPARRRIDDLPLPAEGNLSDDLRAARDDERF